MESETGVKRIRNGRQIEFEAGVKSSLKPASNRVRNRRRIFLKFSIFVAAVDAAGSPPNRHPKAAGTPTKSRRTVEAPAAAAAAAKIETYDFVRGQSSPTRRQALVQQ